MTVRKSGIGDGSPSGAAALRRWAAVGALLLWIAVPSAHVEAGDPWKECKAAADCDDGNECTDDFCQGGRCVEQPVECDDGDDCTDDDCDPRTGECVYDEFGDADCSASLDASILLSCSGNSLTVEFTVTNEGDCATSFSYELDLTDMQPSTFEISGMPRSGTTSELDPGESETIEETFSIPPNSPPPAQPDAPYGSLGLVRLTVDYDGEECSTDERYVVLIGPSVSLKRMLFTDSGEILEWPGGMTLSPPPGGWHYDADGAGTLAPVRYEFNDEPTLNAVFEVTNNLEEQCTDILYRMKVGSTVVLDPPASMDVSGATLPFEHTLAGVGFTEAIPSSDVISRLTSSVVFEISSDQGHTWYSGGSGGPTEWFIMRSLGVFGETVYDLGLQKVTDYATGVSSDGAIAGGVASGIDGDLAYDPTQFAVPSPILNLYSAGGAVCQANAYLMEYLMHIAGVGANVQFIWGGIPTHEIDYCFGGWEGPSFRSTAGAHDLAPATPHFTYHAQTVVGGVNYDPSYGTVGLPTLDEFAPAGGAGMQTGGGLPPQVLLPCSSWVCPH